MHTSIQQPLAVDASWFRWLARACALTLVVIWFVFVLMEAIGARFEVPSPATQYQGAALAIVFAGYAIGWRKEFAGGAIAILGTIAFFVVNRLLADGFPNAPAALFAAPGVLYLLAWYEERANGASQARQL